jgi:hypothetical protein
MKTLLLALFIFALVLNASFVNAQGVFTFCKNVDDNVYPVNPVSEISAGELVYFHFSYEMPIGTEGGNNITVGWVIHTIGDDGMDNGFVNEYFTYFEPGNRRFCTTEPFNFSVPGKYRVYAINWDDRQLNHHTGNLIKYYAVNEIIVK